ncbi:UNVERIFIED_CONTAM: hypothetical protein ABID98_000263 [Brevibacillus sp. OAP136]
MQKSAAPLWPCLLRAVRTGANEKTETAPQSHTLRGGRVSKMICGAKAFPFFRLRLAGMSKAAPRFFAKIPSLWWL